MFPRWDEWLEKIPDPRQAGKTSYDLKTLLWLSVLMLLSGQESRNQYNHHLLTEETLHILKKLFGLNIEDIPHGDTLAHLWKQLDVAHLSGLKLAMIRTLIRRKLLNSFRFKGRFLLAVDGVEIFRFKNRHCPHCLFGKVGKSDQEQFYHRVLEIKLVSACGLSLSVVSEMIENSSPHEKKQDCELKAFYRLATQLKKLFPQLPITLLADGLYPNGPVFALCQSYGWKFIFVLQDDNLKSVWEDYEGLFGMPLNALGVKEKDQLFMTHKSIQNKETTLLHRWQNDLFYQGKDFQGTLNLMDVFQLKAETGEYIRTRAFITNYTLSEQILERLEQIGQQRWKIENQGFDVQKNHGYALEHTYCHDSNCLRQLPDNAIKVVYQLIQIAHLINQLVLKADILGAFHTLHQCFKSYFLEFLISLRLQWNDLWEQEWLNLSQQTIQIRWKE